MSERRERVRERYIKTERERARETDRGIYRARDKERYGERYIYGERETEIDMERDAYIHTLSLSLLSLSLCVFLSQQWSYKFVEVHTGLYTHTHTITHIHTITHNITRPFFPSLSFSFYLSLLFHRNICKKEERRLCFLEHIASGRERGRERLCFLKHIASSRERDRDRERERWRRGKIEKFTLEHRT